MDWLNPYNIRIISHQLYFSFRGTNYFNNIDRTDFCSVFIQFIKEGDYLLLYKGLSHLVRTDWGSFRSPP